MRERRQIEANGERGRKEEEEGLFFHRASCLSRSGVRCWDSFGLSSAAHTDAATICHRWRDGTDAGGKRRRENQNNPELQKAGSRASAQQGGRRSG